MDSQVGVVKQVQERGTSVLLETCCPSVRLNATAKIPAGLADIIVPKGNPSVQDEVMEQTAPCCGGNFCRTTNPKGCPSGVCDNVQQQPQPPPPAESRSSAWDRKANISLSDLVVLEKIVLDGSSIDLVEDLAAHTLDNFSFSVVGKILGQRLPAYVVEG